MQGLLSDLPLMGILELVNATRQTGVLDVKAEVPYTVAFLGGEIVGGGILDWLGVDAIQASPMLPNEGSFEFKPSAVTGSPLAPYGHFTTDWARASDEWEQVCALIGSPSRVFQGELPLFDTPEGRSARAAAQQAERPLFEVAQGLAEAVRQGRAEPTGRSAWHSLRLRSGTTRTAPSPVAAALDGERNLGEVIAGGLDEWEVREHLLTEIRAGLRFAGSGWVLRDLIWEQKHLR
ncbi:Protein containing PATAN domain [Deinococcus geothermalis DSM 11300]|uniref:Protein containing PATAN domain n=1 Tax=Deinococcus geothermalis (strain DSM 11300 / CIP 105573 / AG-3a) TaxID=319795 RepID=Q1IZ91_DEIGD|nr:MULTISPECIES: DUF4388 domain-containing protein [Deinococcus]ABF45443.1 Protein containing PATAN domain [Deinococcus geothermalis DSM 11300]MBI0445895.1 DUF4388 domain-containing protein [Deinococcus sp. DB0503]TDE87323.1 DUF4388 domain-containing protein [Deinococcus sp. S9]